MSLMRSPTTVAARYNENPCDNEKSTELYFILNFLHLVGDAYTSRRIGILFGS